MRTCPDELQIFTVAGNRDIGNNVAREMSWTGYSAQFMEEPGGSYTLNWLYINTFNYAWFEQLLHETLIIPFLQPFYYFHFGGRYFIFLDTQCYKLDFDYGLELRAKQDAWLELLFRQIPRSAPKTIVMHTALFIEYREEEKATEKLKSLPIEVREWMIELFSYNSVDTVFSGHVHFENFPEPIEGLRQVVMTSINALNTWHSKETNIDYGPEFGNNQRGYYLVNVKENQAPAVQKINIK